MKQLLLLNINLLSRVPAFIDDDDEVCEVERFRKYSYREKKASSKNVELVYQPGHYNIPS